MTTIYPNAVLLDAAATSISRFIRSDSHNLKYIGIKGLASIVKDYPKYEKNYVFIIFCVGSGVAFFVCERLVKVVYEVLQCVVHFLPVAIFLIHILFSSFRYAADHQMAVIDCLEDRDETLKRKTVCVMWLLRLFVGSGCTSTIAILNRTSLCTLMFKIFDIFAAGLVVSHDQRGER